MPKLRSRARAEIYNRPSQRTVNPREGDTDTEPVVNSYLSQSLRYGTHARWR